MFDYFCHLFFIGDQHPFIYTLEKVAASLMPLVKVGNIASAQPPHKFGNAVRRTLLDK